MGIHQGAIARPELFEREMRAELGKAAMDTILKGLAPYGARYDTLEGN